MTSFKPISLKPKKRLPWAPIIIVGVFVFAVSFVIWFVLKATMGIRVDAEAEINGLDVHELGIEAYPEFHKG